MKRELTNVACDIYHSTLKNRPPDKDDVTKNIKFKPQEKFKEKLLIHLLTREFQSLLCEIF
jgi:hypothetical protein